MDLLLSELNSPNQVARILLYKSTKFQTQKSPRSAKAIPMEQWRYKRRFKKKNNHTPRLLQPSRQCDCKLNGAKSKLQHTQTGCRTHSLIYMASMRFSIQLKDAFLISTFDTFVIPLMSKLYAKWIIRSSVRWHKAWSDLGPLAHSIIPTTRQITIKPNRSLHSPLDEPGNAI